MMVYLITFSLIFWNFFLSVNGNAMLNPKHRGIVWARDTYNSGGYNYMGINCGGTHKVQQHDGKCGLCGDAFDGARNHETGGKYATGKLSKRVRKGETSLHTRILLNTDQGGYFEFRLCVLNGSVETKACFDQHLLKISEGRLQGDQFAYIVQKAGLLSLTVEIPERLKCDKCILQWKYVTGNTFGRDEFGHGCLGCGPQETFINCADIKIEGWEMATVQPPLTPPTTNATTPPTPPSTTPTTTATRAPITTKPKQITRPNQNTQATRHRQQVTDVDEGSRGRFRNNNRDYQVYIGVLAPQTPAVIRLTTPKKVVKVTGVPIAVQPPEPAPVVLSKPSPKAAAVVAPTVDIKVKPVETKPQLKPKTKPKIGGIGIPFNIPPPPKLSVEQIDALNNNKNIIPHHDTMQKYVQVGSSKIIAARDFATMRAHQVQTPPTMLKNIRESTAPTITVAVPNNKHSGSFSNIGGQMAGGLTINPTRNQQRSGVGNFVNEYSSAVPSIQSQDTMGPFPQRGFSSINTRDIAVNSHGEKPKVRYGRTPTPVPLLPSRYSGLRSQAVDPNQSRYQSNQYDGSLPSRYQQQLLDNTQQQQQLEVRSTQIPVVETSTHRTSKRIDTIAPWRPFHRNQNQEQTFIDKPITLFTPRKDATFRPPVIKERYTNFKIGGNGKRSEGNTGHLDVNAVQNVAHNFDPNVHVNSGLHSPENYFGQDVHVYYKNEPGLNTDVFPVTVTNGPNQPTQLDRNIYTGSIPSNIENTLTQTQNRVQPKSVNTFDMNSYDAYNNVNNQIVEGQGDKFSVNGKSGNSRTIPGDKSVSSFVRHQSSSTDNFNVYKAAGISESQQKSNDGGRVLGAPEGGNKKVNILFDAFGSAGENSISDVNALGTIDKQQPYQQQQYNNGNLFAGQQQHPDQYQPYGQQQQQQQENQSQHQQQQQQQHQYHGQYQQQQNELQLKQQRHQQQKQLQYPGQYQQHLQQELQPQEQQQQQQGQQYPHQYQQQQQQELQLHQQQQQHPGQYELQQQQLQLQPQQQKSQRFHNMQQNTPVHFLGQYRQLAEGNNANSDTNFMLSPNSHAWGQSALTPAGQVWWPNKNKFNIIPPSTTAATIPSPSPTPQTTVQQTTTQQTLQKTTDKMDLQIAELKKLREKLDQLQQLINLRQKGFEEPTLPPTVVTTLEKTTEAIPTTMNEQTTQSFVATNQQNGQNSGSVRDLLEKILKRRYMEKSGKTNTIPKTTAQTMNFVQHTTSPGRSKISTAKKTTQVTTLPSTMTKHTAEYIAGVKSKMLKSIKEANEQKHTFTQTSPNVLRNKEAMYGTTKNFDSLKNVAVPLHTQPPTTKNWPQSDNSKPDLNKQNVLQKLLALRERMRKRRLNQPKSHNPTTIRTTSDGLATRLAPTRSATTRPRNQSYKVTPLTRESVMTALRNMGKGATEQRRATTVSTSSLAAELGEQGLEKPAMREMKVENTIKRQQIVDVSALSNSGIGGESINQQTTTPDSAYQRRMELLRRMREYMVQRPTHLPANRPSLLDRSVPLGSSRLTPRYNRPVHIIDHPNNGRPTIYDNETINTVAHASAAAIINNGHYTPDSGSTFQTGQQQNNVNSMNANRFPDVAVSMLDRVKQMLSRKKNVANPSQPPPTAASMTTSGVRVMTMNKELWLKMIQSMSANKHNVNSGR